MTDLKRVFRANYLQVFFVVLAFSLMVLIGSVLVGNAVQKGILSTVTVTLNESEKTIRAYLREPKIAFDNIYVAVTGMLDRGESQEAVTTYLTQTTDLLRQQTNGVIGFNGVYGYIRGEFIDSIGLNPGDDYIPQQGPWYQLAVRSEDAEYTAPYVDAKSGELIISLAQEIYGANGDYYGVLALDMDITWLMEYAQSLQYVEGGYGIIINQYLYTVAHPIEEYRNRPMQDLGEDYGEIAELLRANQEATEVRMSDTDGSAVVAFFRQLYNGWFVGVIMPNSSYFSDLYFSIFALFFPATILMLALIYLLLRLSADKMRSDEESRAKSSFLARMSHEIRTPMNAILGMVELMLRKDLPKEAREEAFIIKQAGTNLLSIINDILDFSKIESDKMEIISAEYHMASLINDVTSIIDVRIGNTQLELFVNTDESLPRILEGDEARLRQVLLNLLSNAVKYTREGHVSLTVSGEITGNDTVMLTFEVADTGIGIKEEDLGNLFGEFMQFDTHRNIGVEGTGLGLPIARSLCRLMGGDITVSSKYGKGSVFTARVPQRIIDGTPLSADDSAKALTKHNTASSVPETPAVRFTAPTARVLIVDDIATNLKVAEGLISPFETRVDSCTSGYEAIELVKKNDYDIVFMDHMMPEMDGVEAVKIIRAQKDLRFHALTIIALTANAVSGMKEMFLESGFSDYLAKPIEISKLNEVMDKWMPVEKRVAGGKHESPPPAPQAGILEIEGIDTKLGMTMTGGTESGYRDVLEMFSRDAKERMVYLEKTPGENELPLFITNVHALKSALASIGASALSEKALFLEKAGQSGDLSLISDRLDDFREDLFQMVLHIYGALESANAEMPCAAGETIDKATLVQLKEALLEGDIGVIDSILEELGKRRYDEETEEALSGLSGCVLISEFQEASVFVDSLLGEDGDGKQKTDNNDS